VSEALSKRRLKMWVRMLAVTRRAESHLREYLRAEHETTLPRFDVMAALWRRRDGVTMSELSRMLLVSNGNATAVVDRLEADGLVRRAQSDTDRRTVFVTLTDEGARRFEGLAAGHEAEVDRFFATLPESDLDQLTGLLKRMGDAR
jgi:DNA-binding MarR family transcriptional regulator